MSERITRAAIRHGEEVFHVPPPGRHHNVIRMMHDFGFDAGTMHDQGFLTDTGRFVDRQEAAQIATAAGQIISRTVDGITFTRQNIDKLFSEDVW